MSANIVFSNELFFAFIEAFHRFISMKGFIYCVRMYAKQRYVTDLSFDRISFRALTNICKMVIILKHVKRASC